MEMEEDEVSSYTQAVEYVKKCVCLPNLLPQHWSEEHDSMIITFLQEKSIKLITFALDVSDSECPALSCYHGVPRRESGGLVYVIKTSSGPSVLNNANFSGRLRWGKISDPLSNSLFIGFNSLFLPHFINKHDWPNEIHADFVSKLHEFAGQLTEHHFSLQGRIVLYVPDIVSYTNTSDRPSGGGDSRVRLTTERLEMTVQQWMGQIRGALTAVSSRRSTDAIPLVEEVHFWQHQYSVFADLKIQLDSHSIKAIIKQLELCESASVLRFHKLHDKFVHEHSRAKSNNSYLSLLLEPCTALEAAAVRDTAPVLTNLLIVIRVIWCNSPFYNSKEQLTTSLRRISSEVVSLCQRSISLSDIFGGRCQSSLETLQGCIDCCKQWKNIYTQISTAHKSRSEFEWNLDEASIFLQIEAFISRCNQLIEICHAQICLLRQRNGTPAELGTFRGTRGPDLKAEILKTEQVFRAALNELAAHRELAFDLKSTEWSSEFQKFQVHTNEVKLMVIGLIHSSFQSTNTVQDALFLFWCFKHYQKSKTVSLVYDSKAAQVLQTLLNTLESVRLEFSRKEFVLEPNWPQHSGQALYAEALRRRILVPIQMFADCPWFPKTGFGEELQDQCRNFCNLLSTFIGKAHTNWCSSVSGLSLDRLEVPLLAKRKDNPACIETNFDRRLTLAMHESYFWQHLDMELPVVCQELYRRRVELCVLRESVNDLCRNFNQILTALSSDEKLLLKDRITYLRRRLVPGFTKLYWTNKSSSMSFIKDSDVHIATVRQLVEKYKSVNECIADSCLQLAENPKLQIDRSSTHYYEELQQVQCNYRTDLLASSMDTQTQVVESLTELYESFANDSPEVLMQWKRYISKVNATLVNTICYNIQQAHEQLSDIANMESNSNFAAVIRISVELPEQEIVMIPSADQLKEFMLEFLNSTADNMKSWEHLQTLMGYTDLVPELSLTQNILSRRESSKTQLSINQGLDSAIKNAFEYLQVWEEFRDVWASDRDAKIQQYEASEPAADEIDAEINRYTELINYAEIQDSLVTCRLMLLECSKLKKTIVNHCSAWQQCLHNVLLRIGTTKLNAIFSYVDSNSFKLKQTPTTLVELHNSIQLHSQLTKERDPLAETFPNIRHYFHVLKKHEVDVESGTIVILQKLDPVWEAYSELLSQTTQQLEKHKDKFMMDLLNAAKELNKAIASLTEDFAENGPLDETWQLDDARASIASFRERCLRLRDEEIEINNGLKMFNIIHASSKSLKDLLANLNRIDMVWTLVDEWRKLHHDWDLSKVQDVDVAEMRSKIVSLEKRLSTEGSPSDRGVWQIVEQTGVNISRYLYLLPVLTDLKNPALRQRHWQKIKLAVRRDFSELDDLMIGSLFEWNFTSYTDQISNISFCASKEFLIEQTLNKIQTTWEETMVNIFSYKENRGFVLELPKNFFQILEDNQVTLTTVKTSRFFEPFKEIVSRWEKTLVEICSCLESMLAVQKQWMYLESVFFSEDTQREMPQLTETFGGVTSEWNSLLTELKQDTHVLTIIQRQGLMELCRKLFSELEYVQKQLEIYLESKRYKFPRFYFISNYDLLQILGNSRNLTAIQSHLKKLFGNINELEVNENNLKRQQAVSMISLEKEKLPFLIPIEINSSAEVWLNELQTAMKKTISSSLFKCLAALRKYTKKRRRWLDEWPGQLCVTASQVLWTAQTTKGLQAAQASSEKKPLKKLLKKQVQMLEKYAESIHGSITHVQRLKIVALITIEVHARDVLERLMKSGTFDVNSFDWTSQLRLYCDNKEEKCTISQSKASFSYGCEYYGSTSRLVITPLTDRCYLTLTCAMHLYRGACLKGPAGTGKTETVKDLAKSMARLIVLTNCSESLDYINMGRIFSGLAQTGSWGCFDEFNRISVEVLSVVAQQIMTILQALAAGAPRFLFQEVEIPLIHSVGLFTTFNPGYAGRTELPDNLKHVFRPIAMVVPDSEIIAEIVLLGEGFTGTRQLAKKVVMLYQLAECQLSPQHHYDFGLRALVGLLRYSGRIKRLYPDLNTEQVFLTAVDFMNMPKLTTDDSSRFSTILQDLFPSHQRTPLDRSEFVSTVKQQLNEHGLQTFDYIVEKVEQLYQTKKSRHATILVGQAGSAKTSIWRTLQSTLKQLHQRNPDKYQAVEDYIINPKALTLGELFGQFDSHSGDWRDGVLSSTMRVTCSDGSPREKWIVLDGAVDAGWIENMNSVMDDNKLLTLVNSERISLPEQVSLLFEVEHLNEASPSTVSRTGVVFTDYNQIGWQHYVQSWLHAFPCQQTADELKYLFDSYLDAVISMKREQCSEPVSIAEINGVISLCRLLSCLCTIDRGVNPDDPSNFRICVRLWFFFCLTWSVCASVDEDGRIKMDRILREFDSSYPNKDTVYDYAVDHVNCSWVPWETMLPLNWKYNPGLPFSKVYVPTASTVRHEFLLHTLIDNQYPVLVSGPVGTGKTVLVENALLSLDFKSKSVLSFCLSAQTKSNDVQTIIEGKLEKRSKNTFVPLKGKKLLIFVDDINMPFPDSYGSQPCHELLRQWLEHGFWYNKQQLSQSIIKDVQLVGAMSTSSGGKNNMCQRLQSKFNLINLTAPAEEQMKSIFGSLLTQKLTDFCAEVKSLADLVTHSTVELHFSVVNTLLPTPSKLHYIFNMRDIAKVFQGLMRSHRASFSNKSQFLRLWIHECLRVYADRLGDNDDLEWFMEDLKLKLGTNFDITYHSLCPSRQSPIFASFLSDGGTVYQDLQDEQLLRGAMEQSLTEYNLTPGVTTMSLVLFRDTVEHVCRILRVLNNDRGNMMLIGVGGSGKQSLSRLAAHIRQIKVFSIEVHRNYKRADFRDDLKQLFRYTGLENSPRMFLMQDIQVVEESFLEDLNCILSNGHVPNLLQPEDLDEIHTCFRPFLLAGDMEDTVENAYIMFVDRIRANLHLVFSMSPVGENFRRRIRMYPALISHSTLDWYGEWPQEALREVAHRYLEDIDLQSGNMEVTKLAIQASVSRMLSTMHSCVVECSGRMWRDHRRYNYISSTSFVQLILGFKSLLLEKRSEIGLMLDKLQNGLTHIDKTTENVQIMSVELKLAKGKVAEFQQECEEYLVTIHKERKEADSQQKYVKIRSQLISEEEKECREMASTALGELQEIMPVFEEAIKALDTLSKRDLNEIKSYSRPPALVEMVVKAVMILLCVEPTWAEAKRQLGDANFLTKLRDFDKDNISDKTLKRVRLFVVKPEFDPETVGKQSAAARSLCLWVRAIESYGRVYRIVEPKKKRLEVAEKLLNDKKQSLEEAMLKLDKLSEYLKTLQEDYDDKMQKKEDLRKNAEMLETKLDRAAKIVAGFAEEKVRWTKDVELLQTQYSCLVGDCLAAFGFICYMGPFLASYRQSLVELWSSEMEALSIPYSEKFSISTFLAKPTTVREWNMQALPNNAYSVENALLVTRGVRWPLIIDPQSQGTKWIKNTHATHGLMITSLIQPDFLYTLETAVGTGRPLLVVNIADSLDPVLFPLLSKSIYTKGDSTFITINEKEVAYDSSFRLFLSTKLSNPHYPPEVTTKTTIINFTVTPDGLEEQLLGMVVRHECPELEEQKDNLVVTIAAGKNKLADLEDQVLGLLRRETSLLDDEELVSTLQSCKSTSQTIAQQLQAAEKTQVDIDYAREGYRPCAELAAMLFFVITDIGQIDRMYQFSLDAYIDIFTKSIQKAKRSAKLDIRIQNMNDFHIYEVYKFVCRGLFQQHKLLFSFHLCIQIMKKQNLIEHEEFQFFLRGGVVVNRKEQMDNPFPEWLSEAVWDNISELERLGSFQGVIQSFEQLHKEWYIWYTTAEPETSQLPGKWESCCSEFQRMIFVRALRADRVNSCVTSFVSGNLGQKFVEPPVVQLDDVMAGSSSRVPLLFILSPGLDPTPELFQMVQRYNMTEKFYSISLGQGQTPIAANLIERCVRDGMWLYLANCHLSLSWLLQLANIIDNIQDRADVHKNFRLLLSSIPQSEFPVSILQHAVKIATEAPYGIRASMKRLYSSISAEDFSLYTQKSYRRLLFSLCFMHATILERRKFNQLGWNVAYDFSDSDFMASEYLLRTCAENDESPPIQTLKNLIGTIIYGGHVTDAWDKRLLNTYTEQFICQSACDVDYYKLSTLDLYFIPRDGNRDYFCQFVNDLPLTDHPEIFGEHANADVACSIQNANRMFDALKSMQATTGEQDTDPAHQNVYDVAEEIIQIVPQAMDLELVDKMISINPCPLNIALHQEVERYNIVISRIISSLEELKSSIRGFVQMSPELEEIYDCISNGKVPVEWLTMYPSDRPLGSWMRDLISRVEQFSKWLSRARPPTTFCLGAFTLPLSFLMAVQQTAARHYQFSIESVSWHFSVLSPSDSITPVSAEDGVLIDGLFLEGADWNPGEGCLIDSAPMKLVAPLPVVHFRPVETRKKTLKGVYSAPAYYYRNRAGSGIKPSYVLTVNLKSGQQSPDYWIKRATAILLNLSD